MTVNFLAPRGLGQNAGVNTRGGPYALMQKNDTYTCYILNPIAAALTRSWGASAIQKHVRRVGENYEVRLRPEGKLHVIPRSELTQPEAGLPRQDARPEWTRALETAVLQELKKNPGTFGEAAHVATDLFGWQTELVPPLVGTAKYDRDGWAVFHQNRETHAAVGDLQDDNALQRTTLVTNALKGVMSELRNGSAGCLLMNAHYYTITDLKLLEYSSAEPDPRLPGAQEAKEDPVGYLRVYNTLTGGEHYIPASQVVQKVAAEKAELLTFRPADV